MLPLFGTVFCNFGISQQTHDGCLGIMEKLSESQRKALELFKSEGERYADAGALEITINFHPDRLANAGRPILGILAQDGCLRSQFETGTSNGGLSAFVGGDRWSWESIAFKGIYDEAPASERPKYGALNHRGNGSGGSPRFGSSYFKLKSHVIDRTTFCYPESWLGPKEYGYSDGVANLIRLADSDELDLLDNYVEAHIHGNLIIRSDVDKLVLDPCYKGTHIERDAQHLGCDVEWHGGFRLKVSQLNEFAYYRGAQYVELAHDISEDGIITPYIIGAAINRKKYDAQDLKKVWHYLARFGDLN